MSDISSKFMEDFLSPYEAEHLIRNLQEVDVREYGSKQWFQQHETFDRLNIQAHKNALTSTDEFIMDYFVGFLIHDLLTSEIWKQKIYPLIKQDLSKISSLRSYLTVNNMKFLFMTTWAESRGRNAQEQDPKKYLNLKPEEELQRQFDEIQFTTSMCCFSLIRFIADHMQDLSVPIVHQMMETNDIPCILVPLLELKPWIRRNIKGETEKFEDQKWQVVAPGEQGRVTKIEAQVWLTIYNMFLSQDTNRKYEITSFRKANLLRLRKYLTEVLLDQLPMLTHLLRALEELSLVQENSVPSKNSFIVQQIPEFRLKMKDRNWKEIAEYQMRTFFTQDEQTLKEDMERLMKLYSSDVFEQFMEDPRCNECGKNATQRCSRCKNQWYCSRECQLKQWKAHKPLCDIVFSNRQEDEKKNEEVKQIQKEKFSQPKNLIQDITQSKQLDQ
eukprot:403340343